MKWFKHYSDASNDAKICQLEDEFGYFGYGVYFKILEFCALSWDGKSEPIFIINRKKIKSILNINYTKIESILSLCSVLNLFFFKISENNYIIQIDKLLEIKDNHTKNLQVAGNKVSENLPLDKNRTDKNIKNNIKKNPNVETVFDYFNERCEWLHLNKNGLDSKFNPIRKTPKMLSLIAARLKDFSVDDCKFVIRNKSNDLWLVENGYFKIQTLFGPKNFEKYLSEAEIDDCLFTAIDIGRKIYDIERGFEHDNA